MRTLHHSSAPSEIPAGGCLVLNEQSVAAISDTIPMVPATGPTDSISNGEVGRLVTLHQLFAELTRARSRDEVYEAALTGLLAATIADRAAILTFDSAEVMQFRAWRDLSLEYRQAVTGHTPWRPGAQNAQAMAIADVLLDENLREYAGILSREKIRAVAFIPLSLETGVFGKFMLYYGEPHEWSTEEIAVAQVIAHHVALILQRKRAEVALAQSDRQLQAILDNSAAVIFLKDLEGRYLLVNRRYEDIFHLTKGEIVGRTDFEIFPEDIASRFRENDRLVLATNEALTIEEYAPLNDGIHTYLSIKFPIHSPDGAITSICGIATDITDRKQLAAASMRLAAIVENSEDAICAKDLNGIITNWNKGAERIFGYTAAEAIGKPVSMLAAPDRIDEFPGILNKIRRGERVEHYETLRRRKDGQIIHISLSVSPIRDASGNIIGASKIARDISDRKQVERENAFLFEQGQRIQRELERSNDELRRANEDLETFAYSASHDLQEPLRTIGISAQLLERRCGNELQGDAREFLASILQATRRMQSLIRDILTYATVTRSAEGPPPSVDAAKVLATVLDDLKAQTEQAKAVITWDELPVIPVHENRLAQLFQNLISNALKYRDNRDNKDPRVHISVTERDNEWTFCVADNGIGIDRKYAESIFGLFKRLHSRDQYPGSGIGLSTCRRIVEQYGGRIWLENSRTGEGSTFCFTLPAQIGPAQTS